MKYETHTSYLTIEFIARQNKPRYIPSGSQWSVEVRNISWFVRLDMKSLNPNLHNETSHKIENREPLKGFSVFHSKGANQI